MTPQHHIIKETSDSFSRLLQDEFKRNGYKRVHIVEEAPKQDAVEGKLPAVSCYLYQVSLDTEGVYANIHHEIVRKEGDGGEVSEFRRGARMWIRLDYLVSAWAQTPEDEQLLLGLVIRTVMENPVMKGEQLRGESFEQDDWDYPIPLSLSARLDEGTLARFWGSLQQPVRPAIQVWSTVPIIPQQLTPFKRVETREISFRDLNNPGSEPEKGPDRNSDLLTRRDLELGGGKR
jgi:hypothetical protein